MNDLAHDCIEYLGLKGPAIHRVESFGQSRNGARTTQPASASMSSIKVTTRNWSSTINTLMPPTSRRRKSGFAGAPLLGAEGFELSVSPSRKDSRSQARRFGFARGCSGSEQYPNPR